MSKTKISLGVLALLILGFFLYQSRVSKTDHKADAPLSQSDTDTQSQVTQPQVGSELQSEPQSEAQPSESLEDEITEDLKKREQNQQSDEKKEFVQLLDEVKSDLPTKEQLKQLEAKDVHQTPEIVLKGAVGVGRVAQALSDNPTLVPEGLQFYRECAENENNAVAIRAECFSSHEELLKKHKLKVESLEKSPRINERIKRLVKASQ